ncbi:hypothetical protein, partial [Kribbia dieselivorans]|uniref:hypothetical protein n=1 Tax=Kribbia dieselivorans TaxID=331526 RepID=UPI001C3F4073
MDLRRGNRAPSPRLVALLEAGRESRAADPCGDRNSASEPARESAADPAGTAVAWAPSRADILAAATAGAERAAVDSAADRGERGGRHRRQVRDLEEAPRPAPLTVPGVLRGGRYAVSAQVLVGLVAVVLVVVAVLGVRVWL